MDTQETGGRDDNALRAALLQILHALEEDITADAARMAPLLRFGATIDRAPEDLAEVLRPFVSGAVGHLPEHGSVPIPDEWQHEAAFEHLSPGVNWSPENRALFWRALARRYHDALPGPVDERRNHALSEAIGWYETRDPLLALVLMAERALVLSKVAYQKEAAIQQVEQALARWEGDVGRLDQTVALRVLHDLSEAIRRLRGTMGMESRWSGSFVRLGMRGDALHDDVPEFQGRGTMLHAIADGLTTGGGAELSQADWASLRARFGAEGDLALGIEAWRRAIEIESQQGARSPGSWHAVRRYREGLGRLQLRVGDIEEGLETLATDCGQAVLDRADVVERVSAFMSADQLPPQVLRRYLVESTRNALAECALEAPHAAMTALKLVQGALKRLEALNAPEEERAVLHELLLLPSLRDAQGEQRKRERKSKATVDDLMAQLFSKG